MTIINYYHILNIPLNASTETVQRAIRQWLQKSPKTDETLTILNACKQHLLDEQARKEYNKQLLLAYPELLDSLTQSADESTTDATPRPKKVKRKKKSGENEPRGCADIMALIVGSFVLWVASVIFLASSNQSKSSNGPYQAQLACEDAVKNQLKSPTSAKFDNIKILYGEKTHNYTVSGSVDAQNSFGAMLRSYFVCGVDESGKANVYIDK